MLSKHNRIVATSVLVFQQNGGQTSPVEGTNHMEGASLLSGEYDESESAASFQQALAAWRNGGESGEKQRGAENKSRTVSSPVRTPRM